MKKLKMKKLKKNKDKELEEIALQVSVPLTATEKETDGDKRSTTQSIKAYKVIPGLAVHKSITIIGWTITHIFSGLLVIEKFKTKKDAVLAINKCLTMADWNIQSTKKIKTSLKHRNAFRCARDFRNGLYAE